MKTIATSLVILSALFAGAAQAAGSSFGDTDNTPFQGVYGQNESQSVSRAQVLADLAQAKSTGVYTFGELDNGAYKPLVVSAGGDDNTGLTQLADGGGENNSPIQLADGGGENNSPIQLAEDGGEDSSPIQLA